MNLYVLAFLCLGDEVLLVQRCTNLSFGAGLYSMVGGKVEKGETARQAIKREVLEEVALDIPESAFQLVHTFHRKGESELVALCFKVDLADIAQKPRNNEPDKHDDMRFFSIHQIPEHTLPAHKQAIECIEHNIPYSEHGW